MSIKKSRAGIEVIAKISLESHGLKAVRLSGFGLVMLQVKRKDYLKWALGCTVSP